MILMGLDFETNGPEPKLCDITEAAWAIYDTEHGKGPIVSRSFLNNDVETMDPVAERITGISLKRCHEYGIPRDEIKKNIAADLVNFGPQYLVAHNARGFDQIIFERLVPDQTLKWIDTLEDLPEELYDCLGTRTLEFMAARLGFLNPFPHAALPDVYTMMKVLFTQDVEAVAARSEIPTVVVNAKVTFENKDLAKARGYFWQQIRGGKVYEKKWVKKMKKDQVEKEQSEAPFTVAIID